MMRGTLLASWYFHGTRKIFPARVRCDLSAAFLRLEAWKCFFFSLFFRIRDPSDRYWPGQRPSADGHKQTRCCRSHFPKADAQRRRCGGLRHPDACGCLLDSIRSRSCLVTASGEWPDADRLSGWSHVGPSALRFSRNGWSIYSQAARCTRSAAILCQSFRRRPWRRCTRLSTQNNTADRGVVSGRFHDDPNKRWRRSQETFLDRVCWRRSRPAPPK